MAETLATPYDGVNFHRGFGSVGKRIEIIAETCDKCSFDRLMRVTKVNPETGDQEIDMCLNPACPNYHNGDWDHLFPIRQVNENMEKF